MHVSQPVLCALWSTSYCCDVDCDVDILVIPRLVYQPCTSCLRYYFFSFFFHMQSSFSPYNTAYLAVLILLLCKLLSQLRSFRLKIDILSCFFCFCILIYSGYYYFSAFFFNPPTLSCDHTQPKRHIYEVIGSLALRDFVFIARAALLPSRLVIMLHVRSRMFYLILLVDVLLEAVRYSSSFSKHLWPKWERRAIHF